MKPSKWLCVIWKVSKQHKAMDSSDELFGYDSLAYAVCEITYETWDDILSGHKEFAWTQEELSGHYINIISFQ